MICYIVHRKLMQEPRERLTWDLTVAPPWHPLPAVMRTDPLALLPAPSLPQSVVKEPEPRDLHPQTDPGNFTASQSHHTGPGFPADVYNLMDTVVNN